MKKVFVVIYSLCITLLSCGLTACANEKQYALAVNGSALLYENLNETYKAGEEITVKVKIKPYEGIKASLDLEQLVKTKSAQDEYWQFTFEMPAHDAVLDITSYKGFDEPLPICFLWFEQHSLCCLLYLSWYSIPPSLFPKQLHPHPPIRLAFVKMHLPFYPHLMQYSLPLNRYPLLTPYLSL